MEDILHQLGCINPANNEINYLSTGAGCCPSTVSKESPKWEVGLQGPHGDDEGTTCGVLGGFLIPAGLF